MRFCGFFTRLARRFFPTCGLERYEFLAHACSGHGVLALRPGERCPFCGLTWREAVRRQRRYEEGDR